MLISNKSLETDSGDTANNSNTGRLRGKHNLVKDFVIRTERMIPNNADL